jgi:hypothetical protein
MPACRWLKDAAAGNRSMAAEQGRRMLFKAVQVLKVNSWIELAGG